MFETTNLEGLLALFSIDKKRELEHYCKDFVLHSGDFVSLIVAAQAGALAPYKYACHFQDRVPTHLRPAKDDGNALAGAEAGRPLEGKAKKFVTKLHQIFKDRRYFVAHAFYTPSHTYWYLFYFDQRDQSTTDNHWQHGAHVHLLTSLSPRLAFEDVWTKVLAGDTNFGSVIHLKYVDRHRQAGA